METRVVVIVEGGTASKVFSSDGEVRCEVIDCDVIEREQGSAGLDDAIAEATRGLEPVWESP